MEVSLKSPVVFLDRDGVISAEKGYVLSLEDFFIFPYAKECITAIHEYGYKAIVITNQSAVGRGILRLEVLEQMNEYLLMQTGVDAIYYCPHWNGDNGGIKNKFQVECNCRKPKTGLIEQALLDWEITLEGSYFIGDRASDIEIGKKMGLTTILVESGYGSKKLEYDISPDFVCEDLKEAVLRIGK